MDKQDIHKQDSENELDMGFIADQSKQPGSDILSYSQQRSISGISFINTPNHTNFSFQQPQLSGFQSWGEQGIQPFKNSHKRNCSIKQQNQSNQQEQHTQQKYIKKRYNEKMNVVNIKQNGSTYNFNSYCLRKKRKEVKYNENTESSGEESERNQLRFLVEEIKENNRPNTRSFKKIVGKKDKEEGSLE